MYDAILVPTDGSDGTDPAVEHGLTLAADYGATLHAVYVVDKRLYLAADGDEQTELVASMEAEGEEALAAIVERAEAAGVDVVTQLLEGVPYRDLLAYAEDADIDLVVMGTHGRTGPDRLANLGSTTERVVKQASMPVLTVRIAD